MINEILFTGLYSSILCFAFLKLPIMKEFFHFNEGQEKLLTAFFGLFIFIDIFNSLNARTNKLNVLSNIRKNKIFLFIIILIVVVQLILIYFGGTMFRTSGLAFHELQATILIASTVIPADWLRKIILNKKNQNIGV